MTLRRLSRSYRLLLGILAGLLCVGLLSLAHEWHEETFPPLPTLPTSLLPEALQRGKYLVTVGNCQLCHTVAGGAAYAGGREMQTPFGKIYTSNITPDNETGIGTWSSDDFWRAIHHGKSKSGTFLYPAFPYPNYTKVTRADAHAMYLYLRTQAPIHQVNPSPQLSFPYNQRFLLAFWRLLYFKAESYIPHPTQSDDWNRGAYLVQGLGHCNACHSARNSLGATDTSHSLAGGLIPILEWYAPPLYSQTDSSLGLSTWTQKDLIDFMQSGISEKGTALGPMSEVVGASLQYLTPSDATAMAIYLKSLTPARSESSERPQNIRSPEVPTTDVEKVLALGQKLYSTHCIDCHQSTGNGQTPHYPRLAGNVSLTTYSPINAIRIVLNGGFPPSTQLNPRPYGMPPFRHQLNDEEIAAVISYIFNSWGNQAAPVSAQEVGRYRSIPD